MAFCLEEISEKDNLVSRYNDMNDKTLQDFIIAAANVGKYFRMLADDMENVKILMILTKKEWKLKAKTKLHHITGACSTKIVCLS